MGYFKIKNTFNTQKNSGKNGKPSKAILDQFQNGGRKGNNILTSLRMGFFGAAYGWGLGKKVAFLKYVTHIL